MTNIGNVATIVLANRVGNVRQDGDVHGTKTASLTGGVDPGKVSKVAVHGGTDDLQE